jgi:hypothetical protein
MARIDACVLPNWEFANQPSTQPNSSQKDERSSAPCVRIACKSGVGGLLTPLLWGLCLAHFSTGASAATISYMQGNFTTLAGDSTVTVQYNAAEVSGDLNVVVIGWNDSAATVKSVSDSAGNTYSLAVGPTIVSGLLSQSIYFAKNIHPAAAGANTVTVVFSKSAYYPDVRILEYSGADPNNPVDVVGANSGNGSTSSASATTTNPADLTFAANMVRDMTTGPGAGFAQRLLTGWGDIAEDEMVQAAGSHTATAPIDDATTWTMQMVAFRTPSSSSAASPSVTPAALSCTKASMTGAGTDACTVTLSAAAASGGTIVNVASNDSSVAAPSLVTVAAGATSASFSATVSAVSTTQTATLSASAGGVSKTFALQLNATSAKLSVSASSLNFGSVAVNTTARLVLTLSSSGTAAVTVNSAMLTGAGFSVSGSTFPLTLNPNQSAALTLQFAPTTAGSVAGQLTLASNSSNGSSTAIGLSGTGTATTAVLSSLTCSSNSITGSGADACTVTLSAAAANGGLTVNLASSNIAVKVPASVTVAAGASNAGFSATVSSVSTTQTGMLTATAGGVSKSFALQLNAAVPTLSINATSVSFGNVSVNTPATQSLTLSSTGTASVTVSSATITGTGFSFSGASFPLTLNPKQSATMNLEFDPTAPGAVTGGLTINSNSSSNPMAAISLSGTGETTSYSVSVNWNAPSSSQDPVSGYHVYRAPNGSSTYQLLTSVSSTQLAYSDSTVQGGQAYNYIVESVDASGIESIPSNVASVTVP